MYLVEIDLEKWSRKVFKIYKSLKATEQKTVVLFDEASEQSLLSKRLLKLVVVLFNKQKGMSV